MGREYRGRFSPKPRRFAAMPPLRPHRPRPPHRRRDRSEDLSTHGAHPDGSGLDLSRTIRAPRPARQPRAASGHALELNAPAPRRGPVWPTLEPTTTGCSRLRLPYRRRHRSRLADDFATHERRTTEPRRRAADALGLGSPRADGDHDDAGRRRPLRRGLRKPARVERRCRSATARLRRARRSRRRRGSSPPRSAARLPRSASR